jgi:hypothetical protein
MAILLLWWVVVAYVRIGLVALPIGVLSGRGSRAVALFAGERYGDDDPLVSHG